MSKPKSPIVRIDLSSIAIEEGVTAQIVYSIAQKVLKGIKHKVTLTNPCKPPSDEETRREEENQGFGYIMPLESESFTVVEILEYLSADKWGYRQSDRLDKFLKVDRYNDRDLILMKQKLLAKAETLTVEISEEIRNGD